MNEEQKELVLDNINFAKYLSQKISTDFHLTESSKEECESIALNTLCNCAVRFTEGKGCHFRTYAAKSIRFDLWRFIQSDFSSGVHVPHNIKNSKLMRFMRVGSFDDMDQYIAQEDIIGLHDKIMDFKNSLTPREKEFFHYYIAGLKPANIADKMGTGVVMARRYMTVTKKKLKEALYDECIL